MSPGLQPGKTTAAQLTSALGQPSSVQESKLRPGATLLSYAAADPSCSNATYQVEKKVVTARFCDPLPEQRTLQYWRHLWKGQEQSFKPVAGSRDLHGNAQFELRAPALHQAVVYDPSSDSIRRVVSYGSR